MFNLFLLICINFVSGHLILNRPEVWGSDDSVALEQPLDNTMSNWVCAGNRPENNGILTFEAGQSYDFDIICGEKDVNAPGCLTGDWHSGSNLNDYAGCALGVNYEKIFDNTDDYYYLSHSRDCAKRGTSSTFTIPENVENCTNCICSWAWAPSRMYSSPGQFYHNCFYCNIIGGSGSRNLMKKHDFINVQNADFIDVTFNDILNENSLNYPPSSTRTTQSSPIQTRTLTRPIQTRTRTLTRPIQTIITRPFLTRTRTLTRPIQTTFEEDC